MKCAPGATTEHIGHIRGTSNAGILDALPERHFSYDKDRPLDQCTARGLFDRDDGDAAAMPAVILEADLAVKFGKQRVVLAKPDV